MSDPKAIVADRLAGGPTDLGELLARVEANIRQYMVMSSEQAAAATLWTAHTHVVEAADVTPYLAVTSPERRSGKTKLLEVLETLVPQPLRVANISDAALFRTIADTEHGRPVVLIDEADAIFSPRANREDLRALLNAGYRRGAVAARCETVGRAQVVRRYDSFGAKALAAIGELPETIADRSIPVRLQRKGSGEKVRRFRHREAQAEAAPLREALERWAAGIRGALRDGRPELPDELDDRAQDGWEPLLAVADAAGGDWPARARAAAVALHAGRTDAESTRVLLLRHIREAFGDWERMTTAELLAALCEREDGPWPAWWGDAVEAGRTKGPASKLARMLKPFDIQPRNLRTVEATRKGYLRADFQDAWERYVGPEGDAVATVSAFPPAEKRYNATPQVDALIRSQEDEPEQAPDQACSVVAFEGGEEGERERCGLVEVGLGRLQGALPVVPGSPLDGPEREALELVKRELGAVEVPTDTRSYIAWERVRGATDETIGVLLATGGFAPPPGFAAWTAYAVRVLADGSGGRA